MRIPKRDSRIRSRKECEHCALSLELIDVVRSLLERILELCFAVGPQEPLCLIQWFERVNVSYLKNACTRWVRVPKKLPILVNDHM